MTQDILQFAIFGVALVALSIPLGAYMARIFAGEAGFLNWAERPIYALAGIKPEQGQSWSAYALALVAFNTAGFALLFLILKFQNFLPWNPLNLPGLSGSLAFNTAISFVTNTNWQSYGGETTMSYFSQMAGLTTQNFVSASTGMAVAAAVARGLVGKQQKTIGNFWADMVRATLYVLMPLSIVLALFLIWQGVPQTLQSSLTAATLGGGNQTIAIGPVAGQIAIKQLGTNGGGFFNANSAHPFENPTALSNFLEVLAILVISSAFCFTFGRMVKDRRQGVALFAAMGVLFVIGLGGIYASEMQPNRLYPAAVAQDGGNLEGKEVRFGAADTALWAEATTAASNGSVDGMHDSFSPLGGMIAMLNIELGEVVFGGVGVGLTGMLLLVIVTVFLAGLMVGRTPEYLGKKIEAREVKLAALTLLVMPVGVLVLAALSIVTGAAQSTILNPGPHGLTELLYAYSSATGNNGSAFAGLNANVDWHNSWLGIAMLLGRYGYIIPILAIAGSLALKKTAPPSAGTFPTHGPVFVTLLVATILIIGALTFLPVLALGPIAEQVSIAAGQSF
jgi:K+-transporting ATPase ATPase A chain